MKTLQILLIATTMTALLINNSVHAEMTVMDEEVPTFAISPIIKAEPAPPPIPTWTLTAGHTIGYDLQTWAEKANWKVVWNLQKDWTVPASTIFSGEFQGAATDVIKTLAANGALIHAQFFEGNKTMVVTGPGVTE